MKLTDLPIWFEKIKTKILISNTPITSFNTIFTKFQQLLNDINDTISNNQLPINILMIILNIPAAFTKTNTSVIIKLIEIFITILNRTSKFKYNDEFNKKINELINILIKQKLYKLLSKLLSARHSLISYGTFNFIVDKNTFHEILSKCDNSNNYIQLVSRALRATDIVSSDGDDCSKIFDDIKCFIKTSSNKYRIFNGLLFDILNHKKQTETYLLSVIHIISLIKMYNLSLFTEPSIEDTELFSTFIHLYSTILSRACATGLDVDCELSLKHELIQKCIIGSTFYRDRHTYLCLRDAVYNLFSHNIKNDLVNIISFFIKTKNQYDFPKILRFLLYDSDGDLNPHRNLLNLIFEHGIFNLEFDQYETEITHPLINYYLYYKTEDFSRLLSYVMRYDNISHNTLKHYIKSVCDHHLEKINIEFINYVIDFCKNDHIEMITIISYDHLFDILTRFIPIQTNRTWFLDECSLKKGLKIHHNLLYLISIYITHYKRYSFEDYNILLQELLSTSHIVDMYYSWIKNPEYVTDEYLHCALYVKKIDKQYRWFLKYHTYCKWRYFINALSRHIQ